LCQHCSCRRTVTPGTAHALESAAGQRGGECSEHAWSTCSMLGRAFRACPAPPSSSAHECPARLSSSRVGHSHSAGIEQFVRATYTCSVMAAANSPRYQSAAPVFAIPTVSAEHPRTALEAAVFCQGRGPPFGDAPPQVAAAAHEPDLPVHDREALNCRRFARRATLYVVRSGRIKLGHR